MPACFLEQIQDFKKGVVLRVQIQAAKAVPCRGRGGGGGVVGILPWKIFKIEMLENDISSILRPNLSVCCNLSFF